MRVTGDEDGCLASLILLFLHSPEEKAERELLLPFDDLPERVEDGGVFVGGGVR